MSRLTITLSEARYRALKEAAAQRGKTIGQLVDESLDFYGIKSREQALDLVRQARAHSQLDEAQAMAMVLSLRGARLLTGWRKSPALDLAAFAAEISKVSHLACAMRDQIAEIDINPVIVRRSGCVAVDALIVPAKQEGHA